MPQPGSSRHQAGCWGLPKGPVGSGVWEGLPRSRPGKDAEQGGLAGLRVEGGGARRDCGHLWWGPGTTFPMKSSRLLSVQYYGLGR